MARILSQKTGKKAIDLRPKEILRDKDNRGYSKIEHSLLVVGSAIYHPIVFEY